MDVEVTLKTYPQGKHHASVKPDEEITTLLEDLTGLEVHHLKNRLQVMLWSVESSSKESRRANPPQETG